MLVLLFSRFKSRVSILDAFPTYHRVLPNDLDLLGHMNNGRYFTITDIARIELLIRAGVWQQMKKRKIYPVMAGETVQFRRPLQPFQRYSILTRTLGWDDRFIYVEHRFQSKDAIHALMLVRVRVIGDGSLRISPQQLLGLIDQEGLEEIRMTEAIEQWTQSASEHWHDTKRAQQPV